MADRCPHTNGHLSPDRCGLCLREAHERELRERMKEFELALEDLDETLEIGPSDP